MISVIELNKPYRFMPGAPVSWTCVCGIICSSGHIYTFRECLGTRLYRLRDHLNDCIWTIDSMVWEAATDSEWVNQSSQPIATIPDVKPKTPKVYAIEAETYAIAASLAQRQVDVTYYKDRELLIQALRKKVARTFLEWPYCVEHQVSFSVFCSGYYRPIVKGYLRCPKC